MNKQNIKALIFDIGGVLFLAKENGREKNLLSSFREACLLLEELGVSVTEHLEPLFDIYKLSSIGSISKDETSKLMGKELNLLPNEMEELFKKVYTNNTKENVELYDFVLKLKSDGYKIAILSNQFHLSKSTMIPNKYYDNFDAIVISSDDKKRKPHEDAFELILQKLDIKPEESIFVDDKQENLDVAEKLNMNTAIFQDNKQFFSRLKELGVQ